ncbi:MAG: hypothetical protein ABIN95_06800, partial [Mucilaginibacter sp.]
MTVIFTFFYAEVSAQKIATFEVVINYETAGLDIPVSVDLDKVTFLPDSVLLLTEITGGRLIQVPYQIESKDSRKLYWLLKTAENTAKKRIFELSKGMPVIPAGHIKTTTTDSALTISAGSKDLLRFNIYDHKLTFPQIKDTL